MNLQEATNYIKAFHNQDIDANTLRKACATGRLKAGRKGDGTMHVRRTEWEVGEEELLQFVQFKYHPRPTRRLKKDRTLHIPKIDGSIKNQGIRERYNVRENSRGRVFYRVLEHLFQRTLPIHGDKLEKYDIRIIEEKITSKAKAEALVQKLQAQALAENLSHQLRYEVESYLSSKKLR